MLLFIANIIIIFASFLLRSEPIFLSGLGLFQLVINGIAIYKHSPIKFPLGVFFMALIYLFHSGFALLFLLGYSFNEINPGFYTFSDYGMAQIFTELSLFLFAVGYNSKLSVNLNHKSCKIDNIKGKYFLVFFLLCFPLYVSYMFTKVNVAKEMGYLATYSVSSNPLYHYGMMFINSCIPMATLLLVLYKKNVNKCKLLAVIMLLISAYSMASGQRIVAITGIVSIGIIYFNVVSEVNKKNILIIAAITVCIVVLMPMISMLRTYGQVDVDHMTETYGEMQGGTDNGFLYRFIREFGDTVISLVFPMMKTGETASYGFGLTYLLAPLSLSPKLPEALVESDFYRNAMYFITQYPEAKFINFGGSVLGEAYSNFGWFGSIVLSLVGVLIKQIDNCVYWAKKGFVSYYSLLLIFVIPNLLRWTRDALSCVISFVFIVLFVIWYYSPKRRVANN